MHQYPGSQRPAGKLFIANNKREHGLREITCGGRIVQNRVAGLFVMSGAGRRFIQVRALLFSYTIPHSPNASDPHVRPSSCHSWSSGRSGAHARRRALRADFHHVQLRLSQCRRSGGAVRRRREKGNIYSRFTNPTVRCFEERLAAMEGGASCVGTGSGMAAILATCMALLKSGDHIVCSESVFGSTIALINRYLVKFGVEVTLRAASTTMMRGAGHQKQHSACSSWKRLRIPCPRSPISARSPTLLTSAGCCSRSTTVSVHQRCRSRSNSARIW